MKTNLNLSFLNSLRINIVVLIYFLTFIGCVQNDSEFNKKFVNFTNELSVDVIDSASVVVIVPLQGCGSCIETWLNIIEKNGNEAQIMFVVTSYYKKHILNSFSDTVKFSDNIFLDTTGIAYRYNLVDISPKAYFLKHNTIIKVEVLDANNSQAVYNEMKAFLYN